MKKFFFSSKENISIFSFCISATKEIRLKAWRIPSFLMLLMLLLLVMSACSNDGKEKDDEETEKAASDNFNATGYPVVDEKIKLELMGRKAPIHGAWEKMHLFTEMEKLTNIAFDFKTPSQDGFDEKKNLTFASMELPDVFFGAWLTPSEEVTYGGQGILIPLNDLIEEHAPNIKKMLEKYPDVKASITTPDGNIYALPRVNNVPRDLTTKMWINVDWMEKLGLEMPETIEEYYNVLKAFKEGDPNGNGKADEIPLTARNDSIKRGLIGAFGYIGSNNVNVIDDKVVYFPVQEGYLEYMKFLNRLFEDDLLDEATYTQTYDQLKAKGKNMQLGSFLAAGAVLRVPGDNIFDYMALPPLTSPINDEKIWPKKNGINSGAFAITSENEYPEATIRWVDYLYSKEGSILAGYGIEGTDWKYTDDSEETFVQIVPDGVESNDYRGGKVTIQAGNTNIPTIWDADFVLKKEETFAKKIDSEVEKKYMPHWKVPFPDVYFSDEQQKTLNVIETDMKTYMEQMEAKFITGKVPFSEWDEYVSTIEDLGLEELLSIYQEAYDAWKKAK